MPLVPTDPGEVFKRAMWEDHLDFMASEDATIRDREDETMFSLTDANSMIELSQMYVKACEELSAAREANTSARTDGYISGYNTGLGTGILAARAEAAAVCRKRGIEWEAEEDLKAELYACAADIEDLPKP